MKYNPDYTNVLFVGLKVTGADHLAVKDGESPEDFHITLAYGKFHPRSDEEDTQCRIQSAIEKAREFIPDKIQFDAICRFEASDSSDGKDVIYARVAAGQLEKAHHILLLALKEQGIKIEDTFPDYKPHMTLAYIDPGKEYELSRIDATCRISKILIGHGEDSTKQRENTYEIRKTDEDKRLVFGWANIAIRANGEQIEDLQGDIVDPEDLEEGVYEYVLNFRDAGEEHIPGLRKKARMVESVVFTEEKLRAMGIPLGTVPLGWWIGFYVDDDETWAKIKDGTYRMFSIEGKGKRLPIKKSIRDMIQKFNPYHGPDGRFTTAGGASSFTYMPGKSKAHDSAIAREKERMARLMPTEAQVKTLKQIETKTRNLKKEQLRVVDRDGNVIMQKQGDKNSVNYKVGEAREYFPGNITIHNHPDGGTFSSSDLSDIGHGATEIRAAAPEGTYILRNMRFRTRWFDGQKTWVDMRDDIDEAAFNFKSHFSLKKEVRASFKEDQAKIDKIAKDWSDARNAGASQEELSKYYKEYDAAAAVLKTKVEAATRKAYTDQYHNWYKENAMKYGLQYEFIPVKSRVKKSVSFSDLIEPLEKSSGNVVLDRDIQNDIEEMTDKIMAELGIVGLERMV